MTAISSARATFTAVAAATAFSGLLASTGLTAAQIRDKILGDRAERSDQVFYRRARDRGEIDLERTPAAVMAMPFDLLRHDLLISLEPVPPARITSIIDDLFLPLVRRYQSQPDA